MKPIYAKPPWGSRAAFQVRKDYFDVLDTKWHYHSEYELAFIRYPYGKRIAGKSICTFENSDLVFYGPNIPHAWSHEQFSGKSEVQKHNAGLSNYAIVVHFSESCFGESFFSIPEMSAIQAVLTKSSRGLVVQGASKAKIADWMEQMVANTGSRRVVLLLQILEELAVAKELSLLSSAGYWDNLNDHDAIRMSSIYEYLIRNFTKDIALDEIAEQAHMSPSAFCRYFKARTKRTLKEFVNELRVNCACQLLEENRNSITQICFEVGFNNISNFNRRFKEVRGITPQQYRINIIGIHNKNSV
ncbi:helix-turn-helix transcriptional regulator [Sphingobacterium olei]|uniref:Helix-turn-helix transcriptional regulator n=1 Tax=Sphingobacterium olei TaxID=2571155 RepID=A0A4U0NYY7_9SPHI|nr:AraC family transcriptional regulator [Sphingobacterium olei]TJZ60039.1 helix-turn-helix transcriptional regulator [Sphingobacterium olei]